MSQVYKYFASNCNLFISNAKKVTIAKTNSSEHHVSGQSEVNKSCLLSEDRMTWKDAKKFCESLDLVPIEPRSIAEARMLYDCASTLLHTAAWTGYQWNGIIADSTDEVAFIGEYYAILR